MVQITTVPSVELSFFVFKIFHILSQLFVHKWVSDSVCGIAPDEKYYGVSWVRRFP